MAIEIIKKYIDINDNMTFINRGFAEAYNNHVDVFANDIINSPINKLDPKDGRRVVITISANLEKGIVVDREFILSDNRHL